MSLATALFVIGLPSGRQVVVDKLPAVIGSAPDAVVRIEGHAGVKPRHACIRRVGNRWIIEADGDGLVQIGNGPPARMHWLQSGDVVALTSAGPAIRFELPRSSVRDPASAVVPPSGAEVPAGSGLQPVAEDLRQRTRPIAVAAYDASRPEPVGRGAGPRLPPNRLPLFGGLALAAIVLVLVASWPRGEALDPSVAPFGAQPEPPPAAEVTGPGVPAPDPVSDTAMPEVQAKREAPPTATNPPAAVRELSDYAPALVWLGFRFHGDDFADRTGWAVAPELIVSTAEQVAKLKLLSESPEHQFEIIAGCGVSRIPVIEFRVDPNYNFGEPGSEVSLQHNVGLVRLKSPLPGNALLPLASSGELAAITLKQQLTGIGYVNDLQATDPYDPLRVRLETTNAVVSGASVGAPSSPSLFKVDLVVQPGLEGWPAFNRSGRVVGMLTTPVAGPRMVSGTLIRKLLEQP